MNAQQVAAAGAARAAAGQHAGPGRESKRMRQRRACSQRAARCGGYDFVRSVGGNLARAADLPWLHRQCAAGLRIDTTKSVASANWFPELRRRLAARVSLSPITGREEQLTTGRSRAGVRLLVGSTRRFLADDLQAQSRRS